MAELNNLKTRTAMNAKISAFVICVEAITYLLLYNLHDCTFKNTSEGLLLKPSLLSFLERLLLEKYKKVIRILFTSNYSDH